MYKDSSPTTPLIFVLSQGTDPAADLYKFAEEMRFAKKLTAISLGQGQVMFDIYLFINKYLHAYLVLLWTNMSVNNMFRILGGHNF